MFIQQFTVKNYRSLKHVHVGDLSNIVVFYGDNDSGKSNLLAFLYHFFKQKFVREDLVETASTVPPEKPAGFWRGEIKEFSDNFFKNQNEPIEFTVVVRFSRDEISSLTSSRQFLQHLSVDNPNVNLTLAGTIEANGLDRALMKLTEAKVNNLSFYKLVQSQPQYLSDFNLAPSEGLDIFTKVMGSLDNAFVRIPTNRFITREKEMPRNVQADLRAETFKNWLFQTSVNRDSQEVFRRILEQFAVEPFSHGRVSLARVDDYIDVFVEDSGLKLPLSRKGTGLQQLLMMLAYVVVHKSPILGIEELEINLSPKSQRSIFNTLKEIIQSGGPIKQIFLTTHSPIIAKRNEATLRGVWINDQGESSVAVKTQAQVDEFFSP
jgi:AAA15 family ATPase/GTPase